MLSYVGKILFFCKKWVLHPGSGLINWTRLKRLKGTSSTYLGESRDTAIIRLARYQQALWGYLARRVHPPGLLGRRFGSAMDTNQKGKAQTIFTLGRTLCDS
jgi:hypothetical protein